MKRKRLTIKNTSRYSDAEVERLVRTGLADLDTTGVHVNVKNSSRRRRGAAYREIPYEANVPPGTRWLITIGIGGPRDKWTHEPHWPCEEGYWNSHAKKRGKPRRGGAWPEVTIHDWREQLVHTAAHEGKHVEQMRHRLPASEIAAEHHAAWVVGRYREAQSVSPGSVPK